LYGSPDTFLDQNEIGHGDSMVRVNVPGERSESTVGHADANGRRMLERVRHGEKQNIHERPLSAEPLLPA
jgi:hypothetical protein